MIIKPGLRFTVQHRLWVSYCVGEFVTSALMACERRYRHAYLEAFLPYCKRTDYEGEMYIILLEALGNIPSTYLNKTIMTF